MLPSSAQMHVLFCASGKDVVDNVGRTIHGTTNVRRSFRDTTEVLHILLASRQTPLRGRGIGSARVSLPLARPVLRPRSLKHAIIDPLICKFAPSPVTSLRDKSQQEFNFVAPAPFPVSFTPLKNSFYQIIFITHDMLYKFN